MTQYCELKHSYVDVDVCQLCINSKEDEHCQNEEYMFEKFEGKTFINCEYQWTLFE